jgi:uncharacterized protein YndB with AHSA1/START domain
METTTTSISIETTVKAPVEKVWKFYTSPEHITKWNQASEDWHSPSATNDLRVGGKFSTRMEAKDGSFGFDFGGTYTDVVTHKIIAYKMDDERRVKIDFGATGNETWIVVKFDAESQNPIEMQRGGWQAILHSFKKYTESH